MIGVGGLGAAGDVVSGGSVIDTGFGTTADCSKWAQYVMNTGCWARTPGAWQQMASLASPPAPIPPPAVDAGTSTTPAPYQCQDGSMVTAATNCPEYNAAVDAAIKAGSDATKTNVLDFFRSLSDPAIPASGTDWVPLIVLGVLGVGAFLVIDLVRGR